MRLSELDSGQTAVVTKILDDGPYAKRITEMGFVRGRKVYVVKNAPLKDPIEYELMGYNISLRRKEASLIEVEVVDKTYDPAVSASLRFTENKPHQVPQTKRTEARQGRRINVALVGNPNSGKTTLFNYISGLDEHVGNYSGVTVDSKCASVQFKGYTIDITDLPGTYSLSAYSPEEVIVLENILNNNYDFIVNVVDATLLERNMYLTTQLLDMECRLIVALNMYDEFQASGDVFNYRMMSKMLATPFVPTVAKRGRGVPQILDAIVGRYENDNADTLKVESNLGRFIEERIETVENLLEKEPSGEGVSARYKAILMLEENELFLSELDEKGKALCHRLSSEIAEEYDGRISQVIADARYGYITGALKETLQVNRNRYKQSKAIDSVLTHKVWSFPIFLAIIWLIFFATFTLGEYPMMAIEYAISLLQTGVSAVMNEGALRDLLVDGIIGGLGSVIVFLPNILLLFLFISILEDSGYMARAAFIMDKLMHRIGLHGKSFIPLIMGFGCNVPAVMASRIIEDKNNRLLTILITPFISCSARLPVYILIVGTFFPASASLVLFGIYGFGIAIAIASSILFKKILFKGKDQPFVMELPPYRVPSARSTIKHMWNKGSQYLRKMAGVIFVAVVLVWSLSYYPTSENSYLKRVGQAIEPVVAPLGFDWKIGVGLVSGVAAKEIIVSTLGVINQTESTDEDTKALSERMKADTYASGDRAGQKVFTTASALSFLAFVLIYFPCIAVVSAVRKETGAWKWALFTVLYTTSLAWIVSFIIYQVLK